jgi:CMP-N-acetylneuraminic acid synthetase
LFPDKHRDISVLGITLARGGSKGIINKNITDLAGKPLLYYTIKEALASETLSRYVVSTDSAVIQAVAHAHGAESPFLRPKELSTDVATSVQALQHAVRYAEEQDEKRYDVIVEIMATNPLKVSADIDNCVRKLIQTDADSVIAVHMLEDHHPARIKKIVDDKIEDFCVGEVLESRRQDLLPHAFIRSGSIYAMTRTELMERGRRYGSPNSRPYVLPVSRAVNVDNQVDLVVAEYMLTHPGVFSD